MLSACCRSPVKNVYARWKWGVETAVERRFACRGCGQPCRILTPEQMNDVPTCTHGKSLITDDCIKCRKQTGTAARVLQTDDKRLKTID
jgi:hypothetical protein